MGEGPNEVKPAEAKGGNKSGDVSDPQVGGGKVVLAIDPGREKSGIALVRRDGTVVKQRVVPTVHMLDELQRLVTANAPPAPSAIVLGDRTGSKATRERLKDAGWERRCPIVLVDEHRSSDEARERYWRHHRPRGLGRLVPTSLQTPPEAYDDYVAVILAERYFAGTTESD